jgi:hypothetical protein
MDWIFFRQRIRNKTLLVEARWKVRPTLYAKSGSGFVNYFYGGSEMLGYREIKLSKVLTN